jgi:phosphoribosylglycinamide formyltransferase 1
MTGTPLRLVVLASGRGSNLAAILAACGAGDVAAQVIGVFSDKSKAGALAIARSANVPAHAINPATFADRVAFDQALFAAVDRLAPDLIVCAGFMRVLSSDVVAPRSQRLINIHPSLLPRYAGLHTHQRVLESGDAEHGASVHFVIPALDAGPVIAQTRIPVVAGDTPETLAARLLPAEHRLLIASIALFAAHRVQHANGRVTIDGMEQEVPLLV